MTSARIILDPSYPLCWESLDTLRIGFDRAAARIFAPTPAVQRFLRVLRSGIDQEELANLAVEVGLSADEQQRLLLQLDPVLVRAPPHEVISRTGATKTTTLAVLGKGSFARGIRERLVLAGYPLVSAGESPSFGVVVEEFSHSAELAQSLLSDCIPHVSVRVTDQHLFLGPTVLPDHSPCLSCVELHHLDAEPALHILAAQLANEVPAAATPSCMELAIARVLAVLQRRQLGVTELAGIRLSYAVAHGLPSLFPTVERVPRHPSCGCG